MGVSIVGLGIVILGLLVLALIVGLVVVFTTGKRQSHDSGGVAVKKCPYCAQLIKMEETTCHFCGRELPSVKAG